MAGGTGVAQITSPGRSIPGMAPISAIARPGDFAYDPQAQKTGVLPGMQPTMGNFPINLPPNMQGQGFSYGPDIVSNSRLMPVFGNKQPNSVTNIPDAGVPDFIKAMGGTLADGDINPDSGIGVMQAPIQPGQAPAPAVNQPISGKGGTSPVTPLPAMATARPPQGQYAPMAPQGQFNVNQASAGALQQALGTTQQAMQRPINIGAYANPYENQVVQQSMRDVGSAAQMGVNQLDAQAGAAKAFGGSRHGIAQAEAMKGFNQQAMDQAAQLRSQGFNTSLQAAMADRQARLGAASQLGGLGQQAFQTGQAIQGQQQQQGLLQQSIQQALIDAARQQYAGYTGAPNTALQAPLAALGVTPTPQSTTNSMQPGLFNYLQLGASMVPNKI
mgnify:CR=1 FL=1